MEIIYFLYSDLYFTYPLSYFSPKVTTYRRYFYLPSIDEETGPLPLACEKKSIGRPAAIRAINFKTVPL